MRRQLIPSALALIATVMACGAAQAQEGQPGRSARFNYPANYWMAEQPRMPKGMQPAPHTVRNGAVPQGSNFLGLNPNDLTPAPKPEAPKLAMNPVTTQVTPRAFIPQAVPSFSPNFGKPVSTQPSMVPTQNPVTPQTANKPVAAKAPTMVAHHTGGRHHSTQALSGKLRRPTNPGAQAAPAALAYDKGQGYIPGGSLHAQTGSSATGTVTGTVLTRVRNHR